jgi:hypothetical protein
MRWILPGVLAAIGGRVGLRSDRSGDGFNNGGAGHDRPLHGEKRTPFEKKGVRNEMDRHAAA